MRAKKRVFQLPRQLIALQLLIISLVCGSVSEAESTELVGFREQVLQEIKSPLTPPLRDYVFIGAGTTAVTALLLRDAVEDLQADIQKNQLLGDKSEIFDKIGQLVPNLIYMAGFSLNGYARDDELSWLRTEMMFKATLYASITTLLLKNIVREQRPDGSDQLSFPSGHTTTAFAFAAIAGLEHGWVWGSLAYAMATMVGYSRMHDNRHYLHDVMGGATIGLAYGFGIHRLLAKRAEGPNSVSSMVLPAEDGAKFLISYRF